LRFGGRKAGVGVIGLDVLVVVGKSDFVIDAWRRSQCGATA
jgi:hypothetical protein